MIHRSLFKGCHGTKQCHRSKDMEATAQSHHSAGVPQSIRSTDRQLITSSQRGSFAIVNLVQRGTGKPFPVITCPLYITCPLFGNRQCNPRIKQSTNQCKGWKLRFPPPESTDSHTRQHAPMPQQSARPIQRLLQNGSYASQVD